MVSLNFKIILYILIYIMEPKASYTLRAKINENQIQHNKLTLFVSQLYKLVKDLRQEINLLTGKSRPQQSSNQKSMRNVQQQQNYRQQNTQQNTRQNTQQPRNVRQNNQQEQIHHYPQHQENLREFKGNLNDLKSDDILRQLDQQNS